MVFTLWPRMNSHLKCIGPGYEAVIHIKFELALSCYWKYCTQLFQLRLSTRKAEKSNTSAKGCWESLTN
jgi:hypothetical protein